MGTVSAKYDAVLMRFEPAVLVRATVVNLLCQTAYARVCGGGGLPDLIDASQFPFRRFGQFKSTRLILAIV